MSFTVPWKTPDKAGFLLADLCDETGAVEAVIMDLGDVQDGGPRFRQCWYCVATDSFICSATGIRYGQERVQGWALAAMPRHLEKPAERQDG